MKSVKDMGWLGKKNGELLGLAVFNGFDLFITVVKHLKDQQNLQKIDLKIFVLLTKDNKLQTLQLYVDKVKHLLKNINILPKVSTISNI